jgi:hypothetical protein
LNPEQGSGLKVVISDDGAGAQIKMLVHDKENLMAMRQMVVRR